MSDCTKQDVSRTADEGSSIASDSSAKKPRTADDEAALPAVKLDSPEASPEQASLTALPFDIFLAIASFFGEQELMNASRACKMTHEIISSASSRLARGVIVRRAKAHGWKATFQHSSIPDSMPPAEVWQLLGRDYALATARDWHVGSVAGAKGDVEDNALGLNFRFRITLLSGRLADVFVCIPWAFELSGESVEANRIWARWHYLASETLVHMSKDPIAYTRTHVDLDDIAISTPGPSPIWMSDYPIFKAPSLFQTCNIEDAAAPWLARNDGLFGADDDDVGADEIWRPKLKHSHIGVLKASSLRYEGPSECAIDSGFRIEDWEEDDYD